MQTKGKISFKDLKKQFKPTAYFNSPNNFGDEGVDHINISIQSGERIGKLLDPAYLKSINYHHVGKFSSVLSLWHWVRSTDLDDNYRRMSGNELKAYAESNGSFGNYVPNFKAIIGKATWLKVKAYPHIIREIKELPDGLKLLSYHVVKSSNLRICTNYAAIIIDIAKEIITAVKENREPDFSKMVDKPNLAGIDYLEGVLVKVLPAEKIEELKNNKQPAKVTAQESNPEITEDPETDDNQEDGDTDELNDPVA